MDTVFEDAKSQAWKARDFWDNYTNDNKVTSKDYVVVLTGDDSKLDYYTIGFLEDFIEQKKVRKLFIISTQESVKCLIQETNIENYQIDIISKEMLVALKKLYMLYKFSSQIIINSFVDTSDANALKLIDDEVKIEDVVALSILQLSYTPDSVKYKDETRFPEWEKDE